MLPINNEEFIKKKISDFETTYTKVDVNARIEVSSVEIIAL